ncbi:TraR/DksA family transcriptional regulator [Vreelandella venusta]|uniref:Conjugal transfer protein TraR n=1 Tax=Vreelandella venusta TaxID=44935 RepID=A0ABX2B932_9GAMM|nr:TraR/DksA family transcriptional regulator [Halomonas venusta]AZM96089.1 TraR/DksA family transcriptional regulator [Halomonas venusta]NPT30620.1 conjugal transfer protein TraR [Halomonas venusta]
MDNADVASEYMEWRLEQVLKARQQTVHPLGGTEVTECEDCGEVIPAARRERLPGVVTCVPCQTRREKR